MKRRLHILSVWLMLAFIFCNAGIYFFVLEFSVQLNRSLMEKILSESNESDLLLIQVTDISSVVRKGSHEIIYNEKLYDVRNEVRKNGSIYFYCIHDAEEEGLVNALKTMVNSNSDIQSDKQDGRSISLSEHFPRDFFCNDFTLEKIIFRKKSKIYFKNEQIHSFNFSSVITPPPKG